jgi:hypothetical protein
MQLFWEGNCDKTKTHIKLLTTDIAEGLWPHWCGEREIVLKGVASLLSFRSKTFSNSIDRIDV